jgi:YegS/Rv2252/BmrU family lipid kinase
VVQGRLGSQPPAGTELSGGSDRGAASARTLVIANLRSRSGATARRWNPIEKKLRHAFGPLEIEFTRGPRDAERIAREGVRAGVERIIVAGGDGTLSEVVTGLLSADLGGYAKIGLLPLGTGRDFIRTLGVPNRIDAAIALLVAGETRTIDAGRVRYRASDGEQADRYFANVASFGLSGLVVESVNQGTKVLGGRVSFLIETIRSLFRYRPESVAIRVDGELVFEGPLILAVVANGEFFGGGMRVAPNALLDDGRLDWVLVPELSSNLLLSRLRILCKLALLYRGSHIFDRRISHGRGRVIEAQASADRVYMEGDGELLGTLPARIELLPNAITLFGCHA